jgi:DNA-binding IclR family transcriptional regulator
MPSGKLRSTVLHIMELRRQNVSGTQSIDRAVRLLKNVATHNSGGLTLAQAARESGLKVPTVHRILTSLCEHGLAMQKGPGKEYFLGQLAYELGLAANCNFNLRELCGPVLARLSRTTADTVFLTTRSGADSVVIERKEGSYPIKVLTQMVGERRPLGSTVAGIALLAALPEEETEDLISKNRSRLTRYGLLSEDLLRKMVERARKLGYALNDGELLPEVAGIGMAIPTRLGAPYAALSVVALKQRLGGARRDEVAALLRAEAGKLSETLAGS